MVNLYYAKLQNRMPGRLSELAWRLCIYAVRRELFPQNSKADAIIQLDDLIYRDKRDRLIGRGECGKPYVKQELLRAAVPARPWFFNLSHSGEYAICATAHAEIGCDIQRISSERKRLAEQFFHELLLMSDNVFITELRKKVDSFVKSNDSGKVRGTRFINSGSFLVSLPVIGNNPDSAAAIKSRMVVVQYRFESYDGAGSEGCVHLVR